MEPVISHESKRISEAFISETDKSARNNIMGRWKGKSYTLEGDVKSGILDWKQQSHIHAVRQQNLEQFTHTEREHKEHNHFIRQVRQTGVTLITNKAKTYGFGSPDEEHLWANFGQGAPEVGPIPNAPEKSMTCTMDEITME